MGKNQNRNKNNRNKNARSSSGGGKSGAGQSGGGGTRKSRQGQSGQRKGPQSKPRGRSQPVAEKSRGAQRREEMRKKRERSEGGGQPQPVQMPLLILGAVLLIAAMVTSGVLSWSHITGLHAPGCGPNTPCAAATESVWGKVPLLNWPVAYLGFAFYTSMLIAWLMYRKEGPPPLMKWMARLGVLSSAFFIVVILTNTELSCPWCIGSHAANFAWWIVLEISGRGIVPPMRAVKPLGGAFVGMTAMLLIANVAMSDIAKRNDERAHEEDKERLKQRAGSGNSGATLIGNHSEPKGFTGRYLLGKPDAPIRIVMFSDYQCKDCQRIEDEVHEILMDYDTVSLSHKHFPFDSKCNPHYPEPKHANACWAARAAETAGLLHGGPATEDGTRAFWQMHYKLFEIEGTFYDDTLPPMLREMGYDPDEFIDMMQNNQQVLQWVQDDCDEAVRLGLQYTPMIFINGVQVRGWNARNGVRRAVEALIAENPQPGSAVDDDPPLARAKYTEDWAESAQRGIPATSEPNFVGPADAEAHMIVYADLTRTNMARLDAVIQEALRGRPWVQYEFRHFPANTECNTQAQQTTSEHGCVAARATEAARVLNGTQGFWEMYTWILRNQRALGEAQIWSRAAQENGLNEQEFLTTMLLPEVTNAVADDVATSRRAGVNRFPMIFVNRRWVPRAFGDGFNAIADILDAAQRGEG